MSIQMVRRFMFMKTICPQGVVCPCPGAIPTHIYFYSIQTYSSLKPLGQSKPNCMWIIVRKGSDSCINGHMTKMATMAINSKIFKIFFFRTRRPVILKLGMKHWEMELYKVCMTL